MGAVCGGIQAQARAAQKDRMTMTKFDVTPEPILGKDQLAKYIRASLINNIAAAIAEHVNCTPFADEGRTKYRVVVGDGLNNAIEQAVKDFKDAPLR
jgi:hypothetical protein